jgi:lipopolysaccharide export LptBFGC system permease protein LptF
MTLGGVFMIVSRALQKLGAVYEFSPVLMILIPILILMLASVILLRRSV